MKKSGDPEIVSVDHFDNSVVVTFKDKASAIYPAVLLHAAMGVADAMFEKEMEEEMERLATLK